LDKGIIKITWEKCNEADGYLLYEIIDDAEKLLVTIWNVDITSATIPNCLQGKEHHFQIYCIDKCNGKVVKKQLWIDKYCFFNGKKTVIYEYPTPKLLNVRKIDNKFEISWEKLHEDTNYLVVRRTKKGKWERIGITLTNYFVDTLTDENEVYYYSVRCVSKDGQKFLSSFSTKGICFDVKKKI
jgi:hypothetical protein